MCDYCGCQALDAIAALTAEHDLVVNLSGEARRALQAGDLDLAADRARAVAAAPAALDPAQWDQVEAVRARAGSGLPARVVA